MRAFPRGPIFHHAHFNRLDRASRFQAVLRVWQTVLTGTLLLTQVRLAAGQTERIVRFRTDIEAHPDASFTVAESITYDFNDLPDKHGIIRNIPLRYWRDRSRYNLRFRLISVQNDSGEKLPVKMSRTSDGVSVRIGSPSVTVRGVKEYFIRYKVRRAVNFFEDHEEIYWNVTGTEWSVPIQVAEAGVILPLSSTRNIQLGCFTGWFGATESDCEKSVQKTSEGIKALFRSRPLGPKEGLTIVIAVPAGTFLPAPFSQQALWFLQDNYILVIPFFVLAIMGYLFLKYGRELPLPPVTVRYDPPEGLTPAEIGIVIDESLDLTDITSTVVDLAVRGFIHIREIVTNRLLFLSTRDYEFTLLKPFELDKSLKTFEYLLLEGIFGAGATPGRKVLLSSLKNHFYKYLFLIPEEIYGSLARRRVFYGRPGEVRTMWFVIAGIATVLGFVLWSRFGLPGFGASIISGVIIIIFGWFMPKKTPRGIKLYSDILGFLEFFKRVDLDVIRRLHTQDPNIFHRYLPYALIFGVADDWTYQFQELLRDPPYWYDSPDWAPGRFYATDLGHRLGRALPAMASTFSSTPKGLGGAGAGLSGFSRGGGFSGGGFGGGGGSSW